MQHANQGRKFGRERGQRKAFLKSLANNLVRHESITTTEARAKEIKMLVERLVTYGKKQNVAGLRVIMRYLPKTSAYKLYHDIAPRYAERKGGYTRIIKISKPRKHDASKMAKIEFV
ncbi:50S ribosomal protein L17 [Candidatus Parcubacteria bacterium]|jgi:large subunit ribosomal protein L17|nr:MAG: 50S ribosomal protein L17 [Candidatus Parcubacteria bacterium]